MKITDFLIDEHDSWYYEKRNLINAPFRYRYNKESKKWTSMQICGEWSDGGMCPWQAFLPVRYMGVDYTIYIRERHGYTSIKILYGWHGFGCPRKGELHGTASEDLLSDEDMDVAHPDEIAVGYFTESAFDPLFKRAEKLAREFFDDYERTRYLPFVKQEDL